MPLVCIGASVTDLSLNCTCITELPFVAAYTEAKKIKWAKLKVKHALMYN